MLILKAVILYGDGLVVSFAPDWQLVHKCCGSIDVVRRRVLKRSNEHTIFRGADWGGEDWRLTRNIFMGPKMVKVESMAKEALADGCRHAEAYAVMKYASQDGSEVEYLWNSRDGVTPFIISSRHDPSKELIHTDWQLDVYKPQHKPKKGERIFVDLTQGLAREYAEQQVERYWDDSRLPMRGRFESKAEAIEELTQSYMSETGAPHVVEVQEDWP